MARRQVKASDFHGGDVETCLMCGEGQATRSFKVQEFEHGSGRNAVILRAQVPVWSCSECELEYVDAEGESARHDAVCRHLGRLAPTAIKAIRFGARMTQKQFADALRAAPHR